MTGVTSGITLYGAGRTQDFLCGRTPAAPAGFWCALGSAASSFTELAAPGYTRQPADFAQTAANREANAASLTFGPAVGATWQIGVTVLFDAVTDGNCQFLIVPRTSITLPAGKALTSDIGWLSFGVASVGIWSYRSPTT